MKLIIGGDVAPTESNVKYFSLGDIESLLGKELFSLWNNSDIRIFNLEAPLTDKESPISKSGPNLIAPTLAMKGIKKLNPSLLSLANNHILDQGISGLESTVTLLREEKIPFVGVGNNLIEANKPYIIVSHGMKIGIYACAEHEFSIATENSPGANPFDPLESLDHIKLLKEKSDYVVVLYHGGKEHYQYPSPYLQKVCRKMVEKGADLVTCNHSHCIGCYESYLDSTIVYGQGNFIFDRKVNSEFWKTGLLIKIDFENNNAIDYIPIMKSEEKIRLAKGEDKEKILGSFRERSQEIKKPGFIDDEFQKFALDNIDYYLRHLSGFSKLTSMIDKKLFRGYIIKKKYRKQKRLRIMNFFRNEAHSELIIKALKKLNE